MPRFIASAALSGAVTFGVFAFGHGPALAQSPPPQPSLRVGYYANDGSRQPGRLSLSDTGTVLSGNYWFSGEDPAAVTDYYILETDNTSTAEISGGSVTNLYAADDSVVTLSGGAIRNLSSYNAGTAYVFGGTIGTLYTTQQGRVDLRGTNLAISHSAKRTDQFGNYFDYGSYYTVSGTLQNGRSPFVAYYDASSTGILEFNSVPVSLDSSTANPVPEASTLLSFGLLLSLGGVVVSRTQAAARKKRRVLSIGL